MQRIAHLAQRPQQVAQFVPAGGGVDARRSPSAMRSAVAEAARSGCVSDRVSSQPTSAPSAIAAATSVQIAVSTAR